MELITLENVKKSLIKILKSPIKDRLPNGYAACLDCGEYHHHKLIYCRKCGKKIEQVKEMSWAVFQSKVGKSGSGVANTIQSLLFEEFNAGFTDSRERWNKVADCIRQINDYKIINDIVSGKI